MPETKPKLIMLMGFTPAALSLLKAHFCSFISLFRHPSKSAELGYGLEMNAASEGL
jgi:hypothetical protein